MVSLKRNQQGVTLLEVILVLVIGAVILFFSIQQYLSFKRDSEITQLRYNVDILFAAAAQYYRAHCSNPDTLTGAGSLFTPTGASVSFLGVNYQTLINEGFLTQPINPSRFVQYGGSAPNGYLIQFNQVRLSDNSVPMRMQQLTNGTSVPIGTVTAWRIQVSVNLSNVASPQVLLAELGANCLSSTSTDWLGNTVALPCASGSPGQFAVWERLPSYASGSSSASSTFWQTLPTLRQFKQMYTTYPMTILLLPSTGYANTQIFACGG